VKRETPSKISALGSISVPPAMRTLPDGRSVAVWNMRGTAIEPIVGANLDVPSSKSSATVVVAPPPTTRTWFD
jgi:hypothetical protein